MPQTTPVQNARAQIMEAIRKELVNFDYDPAFNRTKFALEVAVDCYIDYDLAPHSLAHELERMAAELRRVNYIEQGIRLGSA